MQKTQACVAAASHLQQGAAMKVVDEVGDQWPSVIARRLLLQLLLQQGLGLQHAPLRGLAAAFAAGAPRRT